MGMNGSMGPDCDKLSSDLPQPHWNTATTMPYAAAIESMFMMTALTGTSSERNTIMSSRNDRPRTTAKNRIIRSAM